MTELPIRTGPTALAQGAGTLYTALVLVLVLSEPLLRVAFLEPSPVKLRLGAIVPLNLTPKTVSQPESQSAPNLVHAVRSAPRSQQTTKMPGGPPPLPDQFKLSDVSAKLKEYESLGATHIGLQVDIQASDAWLSFVGTVGGQFLFNTALPSAGDEALFLHRSAPQLYWSTVSNDVVLREVNRPGTVPRLRQGSDQARRELAATTDVRCFVAYTPATASRVRGWAAELLRAQRFSVETVQRVSIELCPQDNTIRPGILEIDTAERRVQFQGCDGLSR